MDRGVSLDAYSITLGDLAALVVRDYQINGYKTLRDLMNRLDKHTLPFFGAQTKAMELNANEIERFKAYRIEEGATKAEINRELSDLRRGFTIANERGPLSSKPYFALFDEPRKRTTYWKEDEIKTLLEHWPNEWTKPIIQVMNWTGWRVSEAQGLQWTNVDWQQEHLILMEGTTKSKESRVFPYHFIAEMKVALIRQRERVAAHIPWLFPREHGGPIRNFEKDWRKALKACGFAGKKRHDFRSTALRRLLYVYHLPVDIAMRMVGWSSREMVDYYLVTETQDIHDAVSRIGVKALKKIKGGKK